jgi:hypothetical protein
MPAVSAVAAGNKASKILALNASVRSSRKKRKLTTVAPKR